MTEIRMTRLVESSPEAVDQINSLIRQLKPAWAAVTESDFTVLVESPSRIYVASSGERIVAMLVLVPHRHLPGLRYHVEDVVVDADYRRRGIARALLTLAMADAPAEVISFDLRSHHVRTAAHALYRSLGFEENDTTVFRLNT